MASPTVQTTSTSERDTNGTSHTVDMPASVASGDLLIANFGVDAPGADPAVAWPSGWTQIFDKLQPNFNRHLCSIAYRQSDGTEGASITVTTTSSERSAHTVYRITGHEDPATQAPEVSSGATGETTTPDPDSITPTGGSKDYLFIAVTTHDRQGDPAITGFPTNYTNGIDIENTSTAGAGCASAERQLTASSENPGTFTADDNDDWVACTLAIHPAAAAGANPKGPLGMPLHGPFGGPI